MPEVLTISTQKPASPALDYQELRKRGIEHIEKTASAIWTDYNIHDPGITTLEFLCYAITELSYRTGFSIPDLLATETDTAKNIHQHFISAKNIFPNKAVTDNDYRKLLIDIEGVKNAWISRDTKTIFADLINKKLSYTKPNSRKWEQVTVQGYHQVLLEFDTIIKDEEKEAIKQDAGKVLMYNRNLCEDFTSINEVNKEEFRLCSEIEIAPQADPFQLMAQVFFNIQLHLNPMVKFYTLAQLFDQDYTADQIFEGPLLNHGFIKEEELIGSELKTELHLSDIMNEIMAVEGVLNITDIRFNAISAKQKKASENKIWIIDVKDGVQPVVNISESRIVLFKDGMPFRPDLNRVKRRFDQLMDAFIVTNESVTTEDISYDTGSYRNTGNYHSIQHHYPKTYGISHWGLPEDAPAERKMQAKQLQGYLYFFDQQLANYQAQLSNINKLFSTDDVQQTYFTQLADDFKDAGDLFVHPDEVKTNIQLAAETPETFDQRRNLFLDHLLSRYSETFSDYINILKSVFPDIESEDLIKTKTKFLKKYAEYSSNRFSAYNFADTVQWDTENISGLEKRLQRLLGFKEEKNDTGTEPNHIKRRTLVNLFSAVKSDLDSGTEQFRFELIDNRSGNTLMLAAEKFPSAETAERQLANVLDLAVDLSKFSIGTTESGTQFIIQLKDSTGKVLAVSQQQFNTNTEAVTALAELHTLIAKNQSEEGMFLVENLLLLPEVPSMESPLSPPEPTEADKGFMPICADENCDDCDSNDPYSFRISIVLPAYAKRFLNIDFRRYAERIIRMETPAHLYPKICWVNNEQLQEFEKAYKDWLDVKAGLASDEDKTKLKRFINILTTLKTVYPPARLQDCSNTEERRLFLLNQNALGILKT